MTMPTLMKMQRFDAPNALPIIHHDFHLRRFRWRRRFEARGRVLARDAVNAILPPMRSATLTALVLALAGAVLADAATAQPSLRVPPAVDQDPPIDAAHPALSRAFRILSRGQHMNALLYLPAGRGPHPVVVMLHGLPGNEQNLDLAQVLRRAGWAVLTFHYRGTWGSEGTFDLDGVAEDARTAVEWVQDPANARASRLDAHRIVIVGHSMGGFAAADVCATHPGIRACILIAPWDPSVDAHETAPMSAAQRDRFAASALDDVDGRIRGPSARQLVDILAASGRRWQLAQFAPQLARLPVLLILATRDDPDDKALGLLPALRAAQAARLQVETFATDHAFNDHRIALEIAVLEWIQALPSAAAAGRP